MPFRITFDLEDTDLQQLAAVAQQSQALASSQPEDAIMAAARAVLEQGMQGHHADFVKERYARLRSMIDMIADEQWALVDDDRRRTVNALACFSAPATAGGLLDHAITIELVSRDLQHDLDAYRDFCQFRDTQASKRRNSPAGDAGERLNQRRRALQARMHARRRRDLDAGGGSLRRFFSVLGFG